MRSRREIITSSRKSSRLARRRRRVFFILAIFAFFLVLGFVWLISWGSLDERINIQNIEITGAESVGEKDLLSIIEENISGKYFWLLSKSNIFIYPKEAILASVLSSYERIEEVNLSMDNFDGIILSVKERKPTYLWCEENELENGDFSKECFFMDKLGYIFDESPRFSNTVFFEFYGSLEGEPIGSIFLPSEEFEKILTFKNVLADYDIKPYRFKALSGGDYKFVTENSGYILFHKKQDFQKVLENLKSALSVEDLSEVTDRVNLEYIDLRFGNKIFYKFEK